MPGWTENGFDGVGAGTGSWDDGSRRLRGGHIRHGRLCARRTEHFFMRRASGRTAQALQCMRRCHSPSRPRAEKRCSALKERRRPQVAISSLPPPLRPTGATRTHPRPPSDGPRPWPWASAPTQSALGLGRPAGGCCSDEPPRGRAPACWSAEPPRERPSAASSEPSSRLLRGRLRPQSHADALHPSRRSPDRGGGLLRCGRAPSVRAFAPCRRGADPQARCHFGIVATLDDDDGRRTHGGMRRCRDDAQPFPLAHRFPRLLANPSPVRCRWYGQLVRFRSWRGGAQGQLQRNHGHFDHCFEPLFYSFTQLFVPQWHRCQTSDRTCPAR